MQTPAIPLCYLAILLMAFSAQPLYSQSSVQGKVQDANGPLAYANVLLLHPDDSSLVRGNVTATDGSFSIANVQRGRYLLAATMVGYSTNYQAVELSADRQMTVGNIVLEQNTAQLEAVTVTAKKPLFEQKIDRLTVNVEGSITAAGATALEVLERSPGVIVNRQSNSISIAGKDGVVVMINNKINRMPIEAVVQMLAGMPSTNIEKIELITTPPANFDAEGNAGFINIVLRKSQDEGLNGSYTLSAGVGRGTTGSAGGNFNYRNNSLNLYGDYSFSRDEQEQLFTFYRRSLFEGAISEVDTRSFRDPIQRNHNARLGLDLSLGPKTVLGLLVSGYNNRWSMDALNYSTFSTNGQVDTLLTITNDEINHWKHLGGNLNVQHTLAEDEVLTFDVDYLSYENENPTNYLNAYADAAGSPLFDTRTFSGKVTPIDVGVARLDYTRRFSDKLSMEAGVKGTLSWFDNDVTVSMLENGAWINDPDLTAEYSLEESIGAAYTSFDLTLDDKSSMKLGLRYEYTNSNLGTPEQPNIVDRRYGSLFPSFFLSRNFNDKHSANFSYSRRITRPTFNDMAPFVIFTDPTTFFSGNPALQPSISDNIKLDYRFQSAMISLQYTVEDSAIVRFQSRVVPGTNQQLIGASNMKNRKTAGLTLTFPLTPVKWWRMQNNLVGNWSEVNAFVEDTPVRLSATSYQIVTINSFSLPANFSAELIGVYYSRGLFGTAVFEPAGLVNIGIQKTFNNEGGTLRFGIDDLFNSIQIRSKTDIAEQDFTTSFNIDFSQRTYKLTYSRNFGNSKVKSARRRTTGAEEERQRVD